jgi:hypothetical protein
MMVRMQRIACHARPQWYPRRQRSELWAALHQMRRVVLWEGASAWVARSYDYSVGALACLASALRRSSSLS